MSETPFVSYAQNGEDVLLWRALQHVSRGFYIDVGAQDPTEDSVTRAFYDRGWRGLNLEPVPHWYERLVEQRPHDVNLRLAASDKPGTLTLFEVEESGLSTSDAEFAHRHEAAGHALHSFSVECRTLDQICADNAVATVHFLKVDCEGAEKQVLEGIALKAVRPWIILVEATEPNSTKPTWQQWQHLLTGRGYRYVFFDGLNRYYVADEHAELEAAFTAPANILDGARRISEVRLEARLAKLHERVDDLRGAAVTNAVRAELASVIDHRDRVAAERDRIVADRDRVAAERDRIAAERDNLTAQYAGAVAAHHALEVQLTALRSSTSWRVTKPLRGVSRALRAVAGGCCRAVVYVARRCARGLRPLLRRMAISHVVRKLAVRVFGKHSRVMERSRRFLFGAGRPASVSAALPAPDQEAARLRGILQSVIAERSAVRPGTRVAGEQFDPDVVMEQVEHEMLYRIAQRLVQ